MPSSSIPFWYPLDALAPGPATSTGFIHRLAIRSGCVKSMPVSITHVCTPLLPNCPVFQAVAIWMSGMFHCL